MNKRCLYCYEPLPNDTSGDFHEHCSETFFGTRQAPELDYSLDDMALLAKQVVERSIAVPGVQPKLSLTLVRDAMAEGDHNRLTVVGALGGNYIFKPPSAYYPEMPQNEHLTMRMAEAFGIPVVPSSLIRLKTGELCYITKRIDRTEKGGKIHMLDMFQLLEAVDKYKSSMEKIGKGIDAFSDNTLLDKLYFFEIAVFSFLTGNNDMHLKNFSLIHDNGTWHLSPAYDLLNVTLANPKDTEELALTLEGKKKKLRREHFERLGLGLGLTERQVKSSFVRFEKNHRVAIDWIDKSFLSEVFKEQFKKHNRSRYALPCNSMMLTSMHYQLYKCHHANKNKARTEKQKIYIHGADEMIEYIREEFSKNLGKPTVGYGGTAKRVIRKVFRNFVISGDFVGFEFKA